MSRAAKVVAALAVDELTERQARATTNTAITCWMIRRFQTPNTTGYASG